MIYLVTMGGVIDKEYDAVRGELRVGRPILSDVLSLAGIDRSRLCISELNRDEQSERQDGELSDLIVNSRRERFLITQDTDLMFDSACAIDRAYKKDKTIVFTGSMAPFSLDKSSAAFNIGFAFAAADMLPRGIYIAMHGKAYPYDRYLKNKDLGRFVLSENGLR